MINVYVSLFGQLADITGNNFLVMNNVSDIQSLNSSLHNTFPGLRNCDYKIALKNKIVDGNVTLQNGDEIAFLPPFSGG